MQSQSYWRLQSCKHLFWDHIAWYNDEGEALAAVRGMIRTDEPEPPYFILTEFVSTVPPDQLPPGPDWSRGKRPQMAYYVQERPK